MAGIRDKKNLRDAFFRTNGNPLCFRNQNIAIPSPKLAPPSPLPFFIPLSPLLPRPRQELLRNRRQARILLILSFYTSNRNYFWFSRPRIISGHPFITFPSLVMVIITIVLGILNWTHLKRYNLPEFGLRGPKTLKIYWRQ